MQCTMMTDEIHRSITASFICRPHDHKTSQVYFNVI